MGEDGLDFLEGGSLDDDEFLYFTFAPGGLPSPGCTSQESLKISLYFVERSPRKYAEMASWVLDKAGS